MLMVLLLDGFGLSFWLLLVADGPTVLLLLACLLAESARQVGGTGMCSLFCGRTGKSRWFTVHYSVFFVIVHCSCGTFIFSRRGPLKKS